jgi:hypothetical protein
MSAPITVNGTGGELAISSGIRSSGGSIGSTDGISGTAQGQQARDPREPEATRVLT